MIEKDLRINGESGSIIVIDETRVSSDQGLDYPRLIIPCKLRLKPFGRNSEKRQYSICSFNEMLFVKIEKGKKKISDGISDLNISHVQYDNHERSYNIEFPLDKKRINSLEELRSGNDIHFEISIQFAIIYSYLGKEELINGTMNPHITCQVIIPQSHWVKNVLPGLGLNDYFLVEFRQGEKTLEKAWEFLEIAEESFHNWNSKAIYANCREIGALLDKEIEKKYNKSSFTYEQKWSRSFKHLSSLGLHEMDINKSNKYSEDDIKIHRSDAEHLLIVTKALLKYAEELLRE